MEYILAFAALLIAIQVIFKDYPLFLRRRNERELALTHASHGAVMLIAAAAALYYLGGDYILASQVSLWCLGGLLVWGTGWVLTGSGWRSRGLRDGRIVFRCLLKLGLGFGAWWCIPAPYWVAVSAWCALTALVKLALVMRGFKKIEVDPPRPDVRRGHGRARFATIDGDKK